MSQAAGSRSLMGAPGRAAPPPRTLQRKPSLVRSEMELLSQLCNLFETAFISMHPLKVNLKHIVLPFLRKHPTIFSKDCQISEVTASAAADARKAGAEDTADMFYLVHCVVDDCRELGLKEFAARTATSAATLNYLETNVQARIEAFRVNGPQPRRWYEAVPDGEPELHALPSRDY